MGCMEFSFAIITRLLFIIFSLIGVWRVLWVKENNHYCLLTLLCLPLLLEMVITLKKRKGKEYNWFSPAILLFLITIIPSIWILELHYRQNKTHDAQCKNLDSWENLKSVISWNETEVGNDTLKVLDKLLSSLCDNAWILGLHQTLLIMLILGRWLLPRGDGVSREDLSQLLLVFVGTAADILEFNSETLSDVKENSTELVYIILGVWTWSMLQFPFYLSGENTKPEEGQSKCVQKNHSMDVWNIVESLLIQDGPFLVVRLMVMIHFKVFHQMLVFFTIKNFLVVILNLYRLCVIWECRCTPTAPENDDSQP